MDRLTYKSAIFGDYGSTKNISDPMEEVYLLRDTLGKYEDLGYTPEELKGFIDILHKNNLI